MGRGQPTGKLFRGSELPRLVAMIAFTGVLGVAYMRARDPSMWRWIARSDEPALTVGKLAQLDRAPKPGTPASVALTAAAEVDAGAKQEPGSESTAEAPAANVPASGESTTGESVADQSTSSESAPEVPTIEKSSVDESAAEQPADGEPTSSSANLPSSSSAHRSSADQQPVAEQPASDTRSGPQKPLHTDEDPDELEAAREEYEAISDKAFLTAEEMPLYWRMIGWQRQQSFEQLEKRSRQDLFFTHLFDRPGDHRGQILRLKLRLVRSLSYPAGDNRYGLERLYEAWGATEESYPEPYCIVMTELPKDFPIGHDIEEEVTFCGYFVKVMAYKSRDDKMRASPLLVGKLLWHKRATGVTAGDSNWHWILLIGGGILAVAALRFGLGLLPKRTRTVRLPQLDNLEDEGVPIEDWLDQATGETGSEPDPEKNGHGFSADEGPNNGGGTPRLYNGDRFWRYEGRES